LANFKKLSEFIKGGAVSAWSSAYENKVGFGERKEFFAFWLDDTG